MLDNTDKLCVLTENLIVETQLDSCLQSPIFKIDRIVRIVSLSKLIFFALKSLDLIEGDKLEQAFYLDRISELSEVLQSILELDWRFDSKIFSAFESKA